MNSSSKGPNISREDARQRRRRRHRNNAIPTRYLRHAACILGLSVVLVALLLASFLASTQVVSSQDAQESSSTSSDSDSSTGSLTKQQIIARANSGLELIRDWSLRFGREIYQATQAVTCQQSLKDQFDPSKSDPARRGDYRASVVSIDWTRAHADIARTISATMGWTRDAVEAIVRASESAAGNHTHDDALKVEYVDVHRLYDIDEMVPAEENPGSGSSIEHAANGADQDHEEYLYSPGIDNAANESGAIKTPDYAGASGNGGGGGGDILSGGSGEQPEETSLLPTPAPLVMQPAGTPMPEDALNGEWQTPIRFLKLERHANFGDVPISTETSAVHVPVHIYAGEPSVMNAIAWSEELTRVFKNNFVHNPKLTNQYFASPLGFMRLFPAQKWQIKRTDPDLYDARMRPWYVAGASSRKDVIVLIDSSGSMTGSRRDIAKGVTFEILDTLTDNDHFLVLKFNDIVQQVGVPACSKMRLERQRQAKIPLKNTVFQRDLQVASGAQSGDSSSTATQGDAANNGGDAFQSNSWQAQYGNNGTDIDSLYLLPAIGRNVHYVKNNFTLATSGIANFSHALVTAFEVLRKYQDNERLGSQCNQAIMLITDGSPSHFEDIFNRYNYPNAPVRVFTYLIGRETTGDGPVHTKMMACHNRGYYTHVINLAEVRETVQQYIPVMARPLVLNRTHPITWTPAYGELTYQMLTDWIWESRRRERARNILSAGISAASLQTAGGGRQQTAGLGAGAGAGAGAAQYRPKIRVASSASGTLMTDQATGDSSNSMGMVDQDGSGFESGDLDEQEIDAIDIFGYNSNPDCFWEKRRNDLMTTVVQPVYDQRNRSRVVEKFLQKNVWTKKESVVRTANLLGVAAADMRIADIIALAPSHKLGPNAYAIMLTNNGLVMHHPELRSILEPLAFEESYGARGSYGNQQRPPAHILKPFFSSLDLVQVEHILTGGGADLSEVEKNFMALREESVQGKTGWRELATKRTLDCQRRVQSRRQSFYYKPLDVFPFSFFVAIPQPYGSHRLEAQIDVKGAKLPEKLPNYFTTSDFDVWSVHPDYSYCDGPSNNTVTTLLDMFQRIEDGKKNDIQWRPAESQKPPLFSPEKIICDKQLVQSLVYDAVATFSFSDGCGPSLTEEQNLLAMFGVRFSFVATRSGLTRVRHYSSDDLQVKKEALAFARQHARATDETFYARTVDYNMLINETATLIQVPFNAHQKIADLLAKFELDQMAGYGLAGTAAAAANGAGGSSSDVAPDGSPLEPSSETADGGGLSAAGAAAPPPLPPVRRLKDMNLFEKLDVLTNSSLHVIATESIIVKEGTSRAVAGVTGVFYDYASFVLRLLSTTNTALSGSGSGGDVDGEWRSSSSQVPPLQSPLKCGLSNDTIDCLLLDNNGYIVASEQLEFIGRHLRVYDSAILARLVSLGVFHELNITDYQSICVKQNEPSSAKQAGAAASSSSGGSCVRGARTLNQATLSSMQALTRNFISGLIHFIATATTISGFLVQLASGYLQQQQPLMTSQQNFQAMSALLPNKTYLRPCDRILTRYETRPGGQPQADGAGDGYSTDTTTPQYYTTRCNCPAWFVYEQVPKTNLLMLIVETTQACEAKCDISGTASLSSSSEGAAAAAAADGLPAAAATPASSNPRDDDSLMTQYNIIGSSEQQVCSMFERESTLYKKKLDTCISHHPDEEEIKLCGRASYAQVRISGSILIIALVLSATLHLQGERARRLHQL